MSNEPPRWNGTHVIPVVAAITLVVVIALLLAGCQQAPTKPEILGSATALPPQQIPVLVPCMKREQIPTPPATWMRADRTPDKNGDALEVDLIALKRYIVQSQGRMLDCVQTLEEQMEKLK